MSKEICCGGAIVLCWVVSVSSLKFAMLFSWGDSPFLIVGFFVPPRNTGTARLAILNQKTTRNWYKFWRADSDPKIQKSSETAANKRTAGGRTNQR